MSRDKQLTGNAGTYHVGAKLSRLGWNVMLTVRNAKGADVFAASESEAIVHAIQIKSSSKKPLDVSLSKNPKKHRTPWWIFVAFARSPEPICYVVSLEEIWNLMGCDPGTRSGKPIEEREWWLHRKFFTPGDPSELIDAREAWQRLGNPNI
jgi:hypothetical protein